MSDVNFNIQQGDMKGIVYYQPDDDTNPYGACIVLNGEDIGISSPSTFNSLKELFPSVCVHSLDKDKLVPISKKMTK